MITILDESPPAMTSGTNPGSDNLPAGVIRSEDSLPVPCSSTESTSTISSCGDNLPAAVTSSEDNLPTPRSSTESTPVMVSDAKPDSEDIPAKVTNPGDSLPAHCSGTETTAMPPDSEKAVVVSSQAKCKGDHPNKALRSSLDYLSWTNRKLKKLLEEVNRAASQQFLDLLSKLFTKTKVILVVGQSGTGKTSLLKSLTGSKDLKPAGTMSSGTRRYEIHTAIVNNEQFLFVDTPGFGAADLSSEKVLEDIEACLTALGPFTTLVGVIFVYGCPERLFANDLRTIQWLQCFCGPEFYGNITAVTTKWDMFTPDAFVQQWAKMDELERQLSPILCPDTRQRGGVLYHHGLEGGQGHSDALIAHSRVLSQISRGEDRARALRNHVEERYCDTSPKPIQFMRELQEGKKRMDTEAGKTLMRSVQENMIVIDGDRAVVVAKTTQAHHDESDKASSTPSDGKPESTGGQSNEKVKAPQEAPPRETKGNTKPSGNEFGPSFGEKVGNWLRLFYDIAQGFRGAKTQRDMGAGPIPSQEPPLTWGSWFSSWFTGPPQKGRN